MLQKLFNFMRRLVYHGPPVDLPAGHNGFLLGQVSNSHVCFFRHLFFVKVQKVLGGF